MPVNKTILILVCSLQTLISITRSSFREKLAKICQYTKEETHTPHTLRINDMMYTSFKVLSPKNYHASETRLLGNVYIYGDIT